MVRCRRGSTARAEDRFPDREPKPVGWNDTIDAENHREFGSHYSLLNIREPKEKGPAPTVYSTTEAGPFLNRERWA